MPIFPKNNSKPINRENQCTHHHFGLRRCTRFKWHVQQGKPHFNMWSGPNSSTWTDEDGMYINSQEDWLKLLDNFTGSGGKYDIK